MLKRICLILTVLILYSMPALSAEGGAAPAPAAGPDGAVMPPKADFAELRLSNTLTVKRVLDPLRMEMSDGSMLSLSGVDVPDQDAHEPGDIAVAATTFLKGLLEGKQVRIYVTRKADAGRVNRMGDMLAHLERNDGNIWVQGILLANGLARVYPSARNAEMAAQMMAAENAARTGKLGLWAGRQYRVLSPDNAGQAMHGLAVVEGTIKTTAIYNNRIFLNFGDDYRSDFTIGITPALRRRYANANQDPLQFANRHVRVHGWVTDYNGPYIELADPAWLEFIPEKAH
jgi:endonuclease YncB( thermonuclease family)